jgi:aerobic C4-dicarboxylate transport protein
MTHTPGNERAEQAVRIAGTPWYRQLYVQVLWRS